MKVCSLGLAKLQPLQEPCLVSTTHINTVIRMATIHLIRTSKAVKAVWGKMFLGGVIGEITTLENVDYVIPDGTYPVSVTYSPRFQKNLPLIDRIPGRSGIRIHTGTIPEHSKGCVLVSARDKEKIIKYITQNEANNEETNICISSAY